MPRAQPDAPADLGAGPGAGLNSRFVFFICVLPERIFRMADRNIIVIDFTANSSMAYEYLSKLNTGQIPGIEKVHSAAVIVRNADGSLSIPDGETHFSGGSLSGGLIGILVGILGGPLGILLGWGAGTLIGGSIDAERAMESDTALALLGRAIKPGTTALVVDVEEAPGAAVDTALAGEQAILIRQPFQQVLGELQAVEAAAAAASSEARRVVREQRMHQLHEKVDEVLAKLKAKLHFNKK
ncbi:inorganic pyrophosphatase exopolyphosphatase [Lasius niger]|uniref:Inorganic pyrophosphatase exopolyphosphatase n=1 Tax=Lasius niger TaxID=67767 RepID=A0A0J7MZB9_LASNI|nr:inorganic pyrophosphatase exopolyphosphatase [Lasius niger]